METSLAQFRQIEEEHTPGTVKLPLPPRQNQGSPFWISGIMSLTQIMDVVYTSILIYEVAPRPF